jgi:hypothetical protein
MLFLVFRISDDNRGPLLWTGGSWVQIQRARVQFAALPNFLRSRVVGLERGPLSLVSTTEELFNRKVAVSV